jgi:hypothetical protein
VKAKESRSWLVSLSHHQLAKEEKTNDLRLSSGDLPVSDLHLGYTLIREFDIHLFQILLLPAVDNSEHMQYTHGECANLIFGITLIMLYMLGISASTGKR